MALIRKFYRRPEDYSLREHVTHNLQSVLGANRGFGTYLAEVGINDLWSKAPSADALKQLEERVVTDLKRWEPRLTVETLETALEDRAGFILLQLTCRLSDGQSMTVAVRRSGVEVS